MDSHTIVSLFLAFWLFWVVLAGAVIAFRLEGDTTSYWYRGQQISRREYEDLKRRGR